MTVQVDMDVNNRESCPRGKASELELTFAIITCSDTRDESQDTAGAALKERIVQEGWTCASYVLVKDERADIAAAIVAAADLGVNVVLTCGGTGLSPRVIARSQESPRVCVRTACTLPLGRCFLVRCACSADRLWSSICRGARRLHVRTGME